MSRDDGRGNYKSECHFGLSEECTFIDIKELPGIELEKKDKENRTESVASSKVTVKADS
jgi:hypothetical protein